MSEATDSWFLQMFRVAGFIVSIIMYIKRL
jgi:hypothetical protein